MDIKINKRISITISIIWILVSMFSPFLVYGFFYFINQGNAHELKFDWLIMTNLGFLVARLNNLVIGIWLLRNANNFDQDKWTWMLLGFIYGEYSLILLMIVVILQHINSRINLFNAIQNLFLLFAISYLLNLLSKFLIIPNYSKILDIKNGMQIITYTQILNSIPGIIMLLMNIILLVILKSLISKYSLQFKLLWIIAILITGLFPIIVYNGLTIIKRGDINAT
jgi:hypothetical protein